MTIDNNKQTFRQSTEIGTAQPHLQGFPFFSVILALMLTLLLEALDQTVVGTALPRIISTLGGFDRYSWSITAYVLASITVIPIVAKLSDQFGRKWFLIAGTLIFLVSSYLAGAAADMDQFIIFRAIQGLGAGTGIALVQTVVGDIFPPSQRAKWQGLFGIVYGVSNLIGPTVGGWLTDNGPLLGNIVTDNTRWRWVFYLNLPFGLLAVAALLAYLPTSFNQTPAGKPGWAEIRRIDYAGVVLVASGTICLLLGLTWGSNQTYPWNSTEVTGMLIAAGVLYLLFLLVEHFAKEPVLPLGLFTKKVFAVAALLSLLHLLVLVSLVIYLPLFLQGVLGQSATNSGELITPFTLSSVIGGGIGAFLVSKVKRYQWVCIGSALIMTLGVYLLAQMTAQTTVGEAVIYMIIAGIGTGPFFVVLVLAAQNALPSSQLGVGTGTTRFLGQLGGIIGLAVVGTVVNNTVSNDLPQRLSANGVNLFQNLPPQVTRLVLNPQALIDPNYREGVIQAIQNAVSTQPGIPNNPDLLNQLFSSLRLSFATAIGQGFLVVLLASLLVVVGTIFLKDIPLKERTELEEEPAVTEV